MSLTDVDDVATDAHLENEIGQTALANLLPSGWSDAEPARQRALDIAVDALKRRTPPIFEGDLSDVTELRRAVVYGALAHLYHVGMTDGSSENPFTKRANDYQRWFESELNSLSPTVDGDLRGPAMSIGVSRR